MVWPMNNPKLDWNKIFREFKESISEEDSIGEFPAWGFIWENIQDIVEKELEDGKQP
jgi:hypothetical protein